MNVLLTTQAQFTGDACHKIKNALPDVLVSGNLEQVIALAKEGEINRVCILWGGYNVDGFECSAKIHAVNPNIPIMVWDSINLPKITRPNEVYLNSGDYETKDFWATIITWLT